MADPYVGEIRYFGGDFAPRGWALCDGKLLDITGNEALFTLIGTTYGGDGQRTFAVPDLRGRAGIHKGTNKSTGTNYVLGQMAGTENVTLLASQMPAHTHNVAAGSEGSVNDPTNAFWAKSTVDQYAATGPNAKMNAQAITSSGGNQPHDNMMPSLTVSYIISLEGIFPQQG